MSGLDWAVLVLYLAAVAAIGAWMGRGQKNSEDFLMGGRSIPWWAALLSLVATEISAATFLGAPEQGYTRNLTYLQLALGGIVAKFVLAYFFITVYYKAGVTTVYEFLCQRFGKATQKLTAGLFLFGRVFADGSRLFIAAITIEVVTGLPINTSIIALGIITILYTSFGGIKAVIYTDAVQAFVLVGAGLALFWSLFRDIGMSPSQVTEVLARAEKFTFFGTEGSWISDPYHVITAILGGFFLTMATHGTDHDLVQRLLTCKDLSGSKRSTWMSGLIGLTITVLFMAIGFLLFVYLGTLPENHVMAVEATELKKLGKNGHFLLKYTLHALPQGLVGLIVAGVLAAAMSSLSSAFNAMTATFVSDFYRDLQGGSTDPQKELRLSRRVNVVAGALVTGFALMVASYAEQNPKTDLLSLALGSMTFFYGALLGIFLVALFSKTRGSSSSNLIAAVVSIVVVFSLSRHGGIAWPWNIVIGTFVTILISILGKTPKVEP